MAGQCSGFPHGLFRTGFSKPLRRCPGLQTAVRGQGARRAIARTYALVSLAFLFASGLGGRVFAQESPYIVTYDHYLEEPGNLEVEYFSTFGTQRAGNDFHAYWAEFEYGATAWWTTEIYVDGQTTFGDSTIFTGFR